MKMQKPTLPKFEISIILKNGVLGKYEIGTQKPEFRFRFVVFGIEIQNLFQKLKILVSKNKKSGPQNFKFDFDFEF